MMLCCPVCGNDIPDGELDVFVRFYDGDEGLTRECPRCSTVVYWKMSIQKERRRGR